MTRSTRGAARISVVWMISVLVLFFASLGFAFVATSDLNRETGAKERAQEAEKTAIARVDEETVAARATAEAIGWYDTESADPRVNLEAVGTTVQGVKDDWGIEDGTVKTVADLFKPMSDKYKARGDEIANLRNQVTRLEGERDNAQRALADARSSHKSEIDDLQQQLSDQGDKYQRAEADTSRRIAALSTQVDEQTIARQDAEQERDAAIREIEKEKDALSQRIKSLSNTLEIPRQADGPDGTVLAVSDAYPVGWIDIGANDRLARGTVFDVMSSTPGRSIRKARARVTEVEPKRARIEIFDQQFEFQPVTAGDKIMNPLFSPGGDRTAVLAGRFSTPSEAELVALLARIGIEVQTDLAVDTHYLIVGSALYTDEDGEPLEEPMDPSNLDVYRQAEAEGVQIVSVKDLRGYFVF